MHAGYTDEARAWRDWLLRAIAGDPGKLQTVYGPAGERRLDELTLEWLPGYERSRPVRIGNRASRQLQLDVYGEVLDALHQSRRMGLAERSHGVGRAARHRRLARVATGESPTTGSGRCAARAASSSTRR